MDSFIVSARKYRPSTFRSVVGQDALTTTLKNAIKGNKLAHAYLFCGPRGVGKTTCARIFAKAINCEYRTDEGEACDQCESCVSFNEQRSYSIHELDAASNNGVDDIRSITDQVRIPPQIGRFSVYIIDEVHMLSAGAFNAFLKTLEEPPSHAIFILATTEKHKIIPTILSRCQIYDFNRISMADTVSHLRYVAKQEDVSIDESALNIIAQKSDGGMRDALSIFDQLVSFCGNNITYQSTIGNLNVLDYEYYFRLSDSMLEGDVNKSLIILDEVLNKGFDAQHFITGLSSHLRDVLVSKDPVTIQLLEVGSDISQRYKQQAAACPVDFLYGALSLSNECDLNYRVSKNKRLLVEITLIKICQLSGNKKNTTKEEQTPLQKITPAPTTTPETDTKHNPKPDSNTNAAINTAIQTIPDGQTPEKTNEYKEATKPSAGKTNTTKSANAPKSISISSLKNNNLPSSVFVSGEADTTVTQKKPFTDEELVEKWKEYSSRPELDAGTRAFMDSHLPASRENSFIEIFVDNKFQEKELLQMDVLSFLRKELNNDRIRFKIELTPETEAKKHQTPHEIYQRMATDFPVLEKLRKNLEMEID